MEVPFQPVPPENRRFFGWGLALPQIKWKYAGLSLKLGNSACIYWYLFVE